MDAVVVQGNSTAIAAKVNEHLVAAADHVALLPSIGGEFVAGVDRLERLAPPLVGLGAVA